MEESMMTVAHASEGFSFLALFMRADWIVKIVMAILAFMSVWSWAIAVEKWLAMRSLHAKGRAFEREFWSGQSLDALAEKFARNPRDPFAKVFAAGLREWKGANPGGRVAKAAGAEAGRELSAAESGLGILATIASAAPFVGLFGTVWGILNSFRAIAAQGDANLAVVAPGIAEALFATALGLLAAIPAVIFFNALSSNIGQYAAKLEGFVDELSALAERGSE
ncbi:protein TolQ [Maricaulis sp. D1M11]|uniref:protein TolQ n=1 Tax=Maricaulis sp. D1M11 TaxID=3076117 RepID=UPI0039B622F6